MCTRRRLSFFPTLPLGLQVFRDRHSPHLAFGEMHTSGLKESCRYTSEEKRGSHKTLLNKYVSQETLPSSPETSNSLCTSPSFYLVLLQFVDLHLEAEDHI